jgi:hypothetical protein
MFSKLSKIIIVASLVFFVPIKSYANGDINVTQVSFVDIDTNYWASSAIMNLAKTNVISGYEDNTFKPDNHVTREEFASLIAKQFYLDLPGTTAKQTFYDVPSDRWSFPYIEASKEFLTGYYPPSGKSFFSPTLDATREDVAVTLVKTLGYQPDELQDQNILARNFNDVDSISPSLRPYVALAVEKQLFSGYPDGTFRGDQQVSRAEVATLLYKIIKNAAADGESDLKLDVSVPETTSNGTFYVAGETTKGATVTINDKEVEVIQGLFKEGYKINQGEGSYKVVITARIPGGKSKTVTKEITYEQGGPKLTVDDIPEQTNKGTVSISWSVSDENNLSTKVYVNDEVQDNWTNSKTIDLVEGSNTITVRAVNSNDKSTTVTKTITFNNGGPLLKVDSIPETTDKDSVSVSWSVSDNNDSSPKVYINDEEQYSWNTSKIIKLSEGVNTIVFKATNSSGKTATITKTISLGTGAPTLKLGEIQSSTETEKLNVSWTVSDKNDSSPKVYVNGEEQYSWNTSKTITLEPGENTIVVKAVNSSGKQSVVSKTVTFNPPAPKLTPGYIPGTTSASSITLTWTISDKNDSSPQVYINDELQYSWNSSKTITLTKGANQITFLGTNKYGKQTSVTDTVYKN